MLPYRARQSVKPKDPQRYVVRPSKIAALTAIAIALFVPLVGLVPLMGYGINGTTSY